MGVRKLIYIPSQEMWDSVIEQARSEGRSVSAYLLNIHCEHLGCLGNSKWDIDSSTKECDCVYEKEKNVHKEKKERESDSYVMKSDWKDDFFSPKPKKGKKK